MDLIGQSINCAKYYCNDDGMFFDLWVYCVVECEIEQYPKTKIEGYVPDLIGVI